MPSWTIHRVTTRDARFLLQPGEGADAVHTTPIYAYAVALLHADAGGDPGTAQQGTGLAFTLGGGNELVCAAIEILAAPLIGREIEEVMAGFGAISARSPIITSCAGSGHTRGSST